MDPYKNNAPATPSEFVASMTHTSEGVSELIITSCRDGSQIKLGLDETLRLQDFLNASIASE